MSTDLSPTRRGFLKSAAATSAVLAAANAITAHAAGSDEIRVGMVGCGGRGKGACENVLNSSKGVKIVALGDAFKEKAYDLRAHLTDWIKKEPKAGDPRTVGNEAARKFGNQVDVTPDRCFGGLDAYEKVITCPDVNYVMLATPPGFRPMHIQAAVAAGKNLFTEKPVGVDATGIRKVLAAYEEANKKGLYVIAGTQRRHQLGYQKTIEQIHDGAIGDVVNLRVYWNGGGIWFNKRKPDMTDVAYQLNNWYHFVWLCGDHIVEQHVHNLDVANWVMHGPPEKADGAGGRTPGNPSRPAGPPEVTGNIYDNFSIDYTYPNGVHMYSSCRHIPACNTVDPVSEHLVGTKGICDVGRYTINGKRVFSRQQDGVAADPYVQEHTDLIACIRGGKPVNELKQVAESTLTAIMGRTAAYTGKAITWKQMMESKLDTFPAELTWETPLPIVPVPHPGLTKFV
jgi:myo-inositol 2-dehydrogenase / D-chiro-inositol 1-dehydrogenase